jgi:fused signal recognition particle receptor
MALFSKLRARLTRSSSKLEEGLEAMMEDGEAGDPRAEAPSPSLEPVRTPAESAAPPQATPPPIEPETPPAAPPPPARPEPPSPKDRGSSGGAEARQREGRPSPPDAPSEARPGFFSRMLGGGDAAEPQDETPPERRRVLDDALVEDLEDLLIQSDMGVATASRVAANLAEGRWGRRVGAREIKTLLSAEVAAILDPVARPLPLKPLKPQVVLVVGVNGSGKTTTIGKLSSQLRAAGKHVIIAAGDTFRAAAVEQLQVWGERAGVPVLTAPEGSDPASLAYEALEKAQAEGADLLMIDTAGRLQNRSDLMAELEKIVRVIRKLDPDAPHDTLLVLDATVGQNALNQVEIFQKVADVSGLVMTKLDGTAKGGVLVALADRFGLPIHAIGVGEHLDDLAPFDPEEFAAALTGADDPSAG